KIKRWHLFWWEYDRKLLSSPGSRVIGNLDTETNTSDYRFLFQPLTGGSRLMSTVVRDNSCNFSNRGELHEFCRVCPLLICVEEHNAVCTQEYFIKFKLQFRIGIQPSSEVSFQVRLSDHLAISRPQQLGDNRRSQLDCIF